MRVPFLPTLIVGTAVTVMIGLGIWQLQRAEWKERLIAELQSTKDHRAAWPCSVDAAPKVQAGRNRLGVVGYRYLVPCRLLDLDSDYMGTESGMLDIGWSKRPDALRYVRLTRLFTGVASPAQEGERPILIIDEPIPPLEASAPPSAADLPNNHRLYATQWFFFAVAAAAIYGLALRRRMQGR